MRHKFYFLLAIYIAYAQNVNSVDMQCELKNDVFDFYVDQYSCVVQVNLMITARNTQIQKLLGSHKFGKNNNDVTGLSIIDKRILYMPSNLADAFKNLHVIRIKEGRLKEVSQNDFKRFINLRYLNLDSNDLEILDEDLFAFNPLLEVIWFDGNRIKTIGQSTFENLKNLRDLDLSGNLCISQRMSSNQEVLFHMPIIKKQCYNSDAQLSTLKIKYQNLRTEHSKLTLDKDKLKSEIVEKDNKINRLTNSVRNLTAIIDSKATIFQLELDQLKLQSALKETKANLKILDVLDQMQKLEQKYQTSLNQSAQNAKTFQQKIDNFQQKFDNKEQKLQDLTQKFNNSQLSTKKTIQTVQELRQQVENLEKAESELRKNTTKFEILLGTQKMNNNNLTNIIANNSLKMVIYEQEIYQLTFKINKTESKFTVLDRHRLQLSKELKSISTEKQQIETRLKNMTEQLKQSEKKLKELKIVNKELSSKFVNQTQIGDDMTQQCNNAQIIFGKIFTTKIKWTIIIGFPFIYVIKIVNIVLMWLESCTVIETTNI